jgi:multisubunit Na+/H+ antiporter MnhB subunit
MRQPRNLRRSVAALLAGFFAVVILSLAADALMHATGIFPPLGQPMPDKLFFLALAYRTAIAIFGGYLVARIAPDRPMRHALLSGGIGLVISAVGAAATWNAGPEFGPHWYPIALAATALPTAWAGAYIANLHSPN